MKTFQQFLETNKMPKILYILRGVPGSGKSFKAKELAGNTGVIFSTDEFWGTDPETYRKNWDQAIADNNYLSKLDEYHNKNYQRTVDALKRGISPIIVDNTNILKKHFQL